MLRLTLSGEFTVAAANGIEIAIKSKKAKALLAYVALSPRKSRSREEVMALLWSDRGEAQARASLRQVLVGLRKDLGEEAVGALIVSNETIALEPDKVTVETSGGGEELLAGFHLHDPAFEDWLRDERLRHEDQPAAGVQPSSLPFPDRPSIAVLPFTNMSGDPEQEYFSDGITEDIITELSRFHSLIVIARNSSFHYKGSSPKVQDVGRELGVCYVVEGSVRKAGNRVRVSAQLVECESGNHVWAERYDRDLEDIFAVQDELTRTVVSTIAGRIEAVGHGRASRMSADSLQAYDLVLRARRHTYAFTRPDNAEAQKLLARAIVLDPANARAHAAFSMSHMLDWFSHWEKEGDDSLTESHRLAKMAVSLDDTDCYAQWSLGCTYLCGRRYRNSRFHLEKALDLNPNDVEARALYGLFLTYIGQPEEALAEYDQAKKVDPHHLTWLPWYYGFAFFTALRFNDAIEVLEPIEQPANEVRGILAASYALVGRLEDANLMLGSFLRAAEDEMVDFPGRSAAVWMQIWHSVVPFKNDADREVWADGLRKAGLDP